MSSIDSDADLLLDLNRALRNPLMSLEIGPNRQRRIAEAERLLKSVAKQLAQRAGDSADDRRSREVIRVRVYNTLAPILLELRTAHDGTVSLARRTLFASIAHWPYRRAWSPRSSSLPPPHADRLSIGVGRSKVIKGRPLSRPCARISTEIGETPPTFRMERL